MENIDNIGKNSLEALSKNNLTESGKKRLGREIFCAAIRFRMTIATAVIPVFLWTPASALQIAAKKSRSFTDGSV